MSPLSSVASPARDAPVRRPPPAAGTAARQPGQDPAPQLQLATRLDKVEASAIRELFKLLSSGRQIISFAGGFPDPSRFDVKGIAAATARVLAEEAGPALQYCATEGYEPLRQQLAAMLWAKGVHDLAAHDLIVTTGSQQALDLIGRTLISEGDFVIVEGPTFLATIQAFKLNGATVISAPADADGVHVDRLEQLVEKYKPKLVYLIPTFGNPSGAVMTAERRKAVLEMAVRRQTRLVEDDPYGDLYFREAPPPSLLAMSHEVPGSRELLLHCGSMSKVLSPGLRVGFLVAPPDLLAKAALVKQFGDACTGAFSQAVVAQYLKSGDMQESLPFLRRGYAERAELMSEALRRELGGAIEFTAPRGGLFIWARLTGAGGAASDASALARQAVEAGVAFVPGAPFYAENPDPSTLRLSFSTVQPDDIEKGVKLLASVILAPCDGVRPEPPPDAFSIRSML